MTLAPDDMDIVLYGARRISDENRDAYFQYIADNLRRTYNPTEGDVRAIMRSGSASNACANELTNRGVANLAPVCHALSASGALFQPNTKGTTHGPHATTTQTTQKRCR
jgi:hypothetical protein